MQIKNLNLKDFSTMKVGDFADICEVENEEEFLKALEFAKENHRQIKVIGEGSNTVFGDRESLKKYLFIKITDDKIEILKREALEGKVGIKEFASDSCLLKAGASARFDDMISFAIDHEMYGIENLSSIPGTAGAAPVQNIGAYGAELSSVFYSARVFDLKDNIFKDLYLDDCEFSYRDSVFKKEKDRYVIFSITLKLSNTFSPNLSYAPLSLLEEKFENINISDKSKATILRDEVVKVRASKLPDYKVYPNCGSFFKNIILEKEDGSFEKVSTAKVLEECSLKGYRVGNFGLSEKHALILVNYDGAGDFLELETFVQNVQDVVLEKTGHKIEAEVNFVI